MFPCIYIKSTAKNIIFMIIYDFLRLYIISMSMITFDFYDEGSLQFRPINPI